MCLYYTQDRCTMVMTSRIKLKHFSNDLFMLWNSEMVVILFTASFGLIGNLV